MNFLLLKIKNYDNKLRCNLDELVLSNFNLTWFLDRLIFNTLVGFSLSFSIRT